MVEGDFMEKVREAQSHMRASVAAVRASGSLTPEIEESFDRADLSLQAVLEVHALKEAGWSNEDMFDEVERRLPQIVKLPEWPRLRRDLTRH